MCKTSIYLMVSPWLFNLNLRALLSCICIIASHLLSSRLCLNVLNLLQLTISITKLTFCSVPCHLLLLLSQCIDSHH